MRHSVSVYLAHLLFIGWTVCLDSQVCAKDYNKCAMALQGAMARAVLGGRFANIAAKNFGQIAMPVEAH